jgi:hypothetical protein
VKSINGESNLAELERLHYARGDRTDIIIRDGYLNSDERDALFEACDCYVSLHRSEGFGLTIAEAMAREKPAIATRYSGNLEFMTDANSFLCGYELRHVGPGCYPYPEEARWAEPSIEEAAKLLRFVYENQDEARQRGRRARLDLKAGHAAANAGQFIKQRLAQLRGNPPNPIPSFAPPPERPQLRKLRAEIEQGVNVRRIVPSLLTWFLRGPRRAMKQFVRDYEQHRRNFGVSVLEAANEIDAEWQRIRGGLTHRISAQEDNLHSVKRKLKETEEKLAELEEKVRDRGNADRSSPPHFNVDQNARSRKSA